MNIYVDYLMKNFGGTNFKGLFQIGKILELYDFNNTNITDIYKDYDQNYNNNASSERNIRYYIKYIINKYGIKEVEEKINCKCDGNNIFTNKAFMLAIKYRAEEENGY